MAQTPWRSACVWACLPTVQELAADRHNLTQAQSQLAAANQARADLAGRLERTGRLHRAERAALAAQLAAADQAVLGWARTVGRVEPRVAQSEAQQARRQEWLDVHAGDLERHAALQQAVASRRADLTAAATISPPHWLLDVLGPYPDSRTRRRIWRDAAGDIVAWRDRHGVTDRSHPLGPHPADPVHAMAHRQLTGHVLDAARRPPPGPSTGRRTGPSARDRTRPRIRPRPVASVV